VVAEIGDERVRLGLLDDQLDEGRGVEIDS
jgi:hypothetical protein